MLRKSFSIHYDHERDERCRTSLRHVYCEVPTLLPWQHFRPVLNKWSQVIDFLRHNYYTEHIVLLTFHRRALFLLKIVSRVRIPRHT